MPKSSSNPPVAAMLDRRAALSLLLTLPFATSASAQSYPDRPIRMIVPFAPRRHHRRLGATDRAADVGLAEAVGRGRESLPAAAERSAPPPRHGPSPTATRSWCRARRRTQSCRPCTRSSTTIPSRAFLPIARISSAPYLLVVNADVPVKNRARARRLCQSQSEIRIRGADRNAAAYPRLRASRN